MRNPSTGFDRSVSTDDEGRYHIGEIPAQTYEVNATAGGFKSTIIAALTFYVGATLVRDIYLEVGDTSETVVVREKGRYMVLVSARGCEPCLAALTVILVCVLVGAPG